MLKLSAISFVYFGVLYTKAFPSPGSQTNCIISCDILFQILLRALGFTFLHFLELISLSLSLSFIRFEHLYTASLRQIQNAEEVGSEWISV